MFPISFQGIYKPQVSSRQTGQLSFQGNYVCCVNSAFPECFIQCMLLLDQSQPLKIIIITGSADD